MALSGGGGARGAAEGGMMIMKMLLSLIPLLLMVWSKTSTDALPIDNNQLPQNNEVLTKEQKDLLMKIMSDLAELNMTVKDLGAVELEQLLNGKLGERSVFGLPARDKSPCKNFFWKTFSAC